MNAVSKLVPKALRPYVRARARALAGSRASARGFVRNQAWDGAAAQGIAQSASANPLETYFDAHATGPGIWKWRHYIEIYHRHLAKFMGKGASVLEVGVYSGGSFGMWQNYLGPGSRLYGVDIEQACKAYESDSVKIFIGDQADRDFWKRFRGQVPPLDIIIDDGGHLPHQQIVTLEETLPHLRPGGVYICEDVHGEFNEFTNYVTGFVQNLNAFNTRAATDGNAAVASAPTAFQSVIHSVHLYAYVVVIEKWPTPVTEFAAPKHGTQWQPFL